jgi:alpha-L-rhamnosidase
MIFTIEPGPHRTAMTFLVLGLTILASSTFPAAAQAANPVSPSNAASPVATLAALVPARLRCEYRVDPLGVDSPHPRLDWILQPGNPTSRGLTQTAYQILVASSPDQLAKDQGDLWDTGKTASDQINQIAYAGKAFASNQACWWKVRVWDQAGAPSAWSPIAQWTMGILGETDWAGAKWIGAPDDGAAPALDGPKAKYETVLLRREFTVKPGLKRAVVSVCGLGQYEMTLNGDKVGDALLTPGWTQYDKTCLYDTYNITTSLKPGANAVGLFLGNGMYLLHRGRFSSNANMTNWFAPLQAIASIRLEYGDGSVENMITDDAWRCLSGPITYSSAYGGEDYDAQLEPPKWNKAGFDDSSWDKPHLLNGPGGTLKGLSCAGPPIHAFASLTPVSQNEIKPGVTVYDLGQNASIMVQLKVRGPAGSAVRVLPAELLKEDGTADDFIFTANEDRKLIRKPVWWQYTLKGDGDETYFSKFFYVGARYLQVELTPAAGSSDLPTVDSLVGVVVHADSPAVGQFSCSNDLFNRIFTLVRWAQQNNLVSIVTDCPTREKRGWLEQDHLNGPALRYNWDMAALLTKVTNDMIDAQHADGLVPSTCPDYIHWNSDFGNSPEWGSACVLVPWQQYKYDGDVNLLGRAYDMMKKYQAYLGSRAKDNIVSYGLGDWYDIGPGHLGKSKLTPLALTGTSFYYEDTSILAQAAGLLGKTDDASQYAQQAGEIRDAFNKALFDPQTNQYGSREGKHDKWGSQCGDSIPLVMGLADPVNRPAVLDNIVKDVQAKGLTAGDVGYRYLLRALADGDRSDVIYSLNNRSDKPGYGYQLKLGKTSLTEGWNGSDSQDHFMLGQINEWFYHDLAGIQDDPAGPGFKKIIIKPAIVGDLTWVKASYDSISGKIVSEWSRDGQNITLDVVIPANTTATICVPATDSNSVHEGGRPAAFSQGIKFLKMEGTYARYEVESGDYTFVATLPANTSN